LSSSDTKEQAKVVEVLDIENQIDLWSTNPSSFIESMENFTTLEKLYIVRQILANPNAIHNPALCRTLDNSHQPYCMEMLGRSHIWDIPVEETSNSISVSSTESVSNCVPTDVWCLSMKAIQQAKYGTMDKAKAICRSIQDAQAREECFFQTAEEIAKQEFPDSLSIAFQFCAETSAYRSHCHAHIVELAASTSHSILEQLNIIEQSNDPKYQLLQQYYLTMKARHSPNNPHLPHWDRHSVQTLLFLQGQSKTDRPLSEWLSLFHQVLPTMEVTPLKMEGEMSGYWVQSESLQHPSTLYLSLETRPFSEDVESDLEMAMIAALVQLQFPVMAATAEVSNPTIKWMLNRASHKR
jgi:hypothetical protein